MLTDKSIVNTLLNPCRLSSSARVATYTQAESSNYTSAQEIRFSLPQESLDLSNAYINMNVDLVETDAEVEQIVAITPVIPAGPPFADAGDFRLKFADSISSIIPFDTTCEQLEVIINGMKGFAGRGFQVICVNSGAVPPYVTGANQIADGIELVVSNFVWDTLPETFGWDIVNNSLTLAGVYVPLTIEQIQESEFAYPRLEASNPIISDIRVDIDGQNVVNLSQIDVLSSIVQYMQPSADRYYSFEVGSESNNGIYFPGEFRVKLNLTDYMPLFRKVLPLNHIARQMRVYLTLNRPGKCLITKAINDGADYSISNVEFHYNRVNFSKNESDAIRAALANNELTIPFISYSNYSSTIPQGAANQDILFNPAASHLLGTIAVMQPQNYISNSTNKRKSSTFLKNKLFSARLKTGTAYHPLDLIKSIQQDKSDVSEYIEEFINVAPYILGDHTRDMRLFFNYAGNYVENEVWVEAWGNTFPPTFVIGISTAATPSDNFGHICDAGLGYSGFDTSRMTDVRLELRGLELEETALVQIFSIEQQYLVFGNNYFKRLR